jgi:hypothetical protein
MIQHLRSIYNIPFTIVELQQKDSSERLIRDTIEVDLKSTADILIASKHPKSLILSIVDLTLLETIFALKDHLHGLPNWRTEEISFELGKLCGYLICNLLSRLSNIFISGSDFVGFLITHCLFDL